MLVASFTKKEHDLTTHIKLHNKETGLLGWNALDAAKDIHKFSPDLKIFYCTWSFHYFGLQQDIKDMSNKQVAVVMREHMVSLV